MAAPPPMRAVPEEAFQGAQRLAGPLNGILRPLVEGLSQGLTFKENFAGEVKVVRFTMPDDWVPVSSFLNGWSAYAGFPLALRKDMAGTVEVRGLATPGTIGAVEVFSWPAGYTPAQAEVFNPQSSTGWAEVYASILGLQVTSLEVGGATWVSFSGVRFSAADRRPPRWDTPVEVRLGSKGKPFPGRPGYVLPLEVQEVGQPVQPCTVHALDWVAGTTDNNQPTVRLHRVWGGLQPGIAYDLTLLVLPE